MKKQTILQKLERQLVIAKRMNENVILDTATLEKLLNVRKAADDFAGNSVAEFQHDLCDALHELEQEIK